MDIHTLDQDVMDLYAETDRACQAFSRASGVACPAGCGVCCQYPCIKTTPLEFIPLALRLWEEQRAADVYRRIDSSRNLCFFIRPVLLKDDEGFCSIYPHRPLICRTFGFLGRTSQTGELSLNTCNNMSRLFPGGLADLSPQTLALLPRPDIILPRLRDISPQLGARSLPLNQAVKHAIEHVYSHRFSPHTDRPPRTHCA